ncbi:MmcQ/YjbR family DNA-binding protein [Acetobacterium malicum]|uniref:MmcQ/YjbR family DNA-binding protein n=1 Tax=Acetobacterium malicum TaxID=52692 RepID=A0ABR6YS86_9FIRM|nr:MULTISPECIES: MmcQ/YjbR family DNA-binding protein [Acetobacterium]MBC3898049.1 MmcQ/YjbR family DNA-binding protein [Acetobacterium malicum]
MKACKNWDELIEKTIASMPGTSQDYQPEWDAVRYFVGDVMFAMRGENKVGESLLTVKLPPGDGEILRSRYPDIIPGYYMNKQHWNSIMLDGNVPERILIDCIQLAYHTVLIKLTKKKQREIEEGPPQP